MRRVGQVRKRDGNEPAIVKALEAIGARVQRVSAKGFCDLVVYYGGVVLLLEVKNPKGRNKDTAAQVEHRQDGWPVVIVRNEDDALRACGFAYVSAKIHR